MRRRSCCGDFHPIRGLTDGPRIEGKEGEWLRPILTPIEKNVATAGMLARVNAREGLDVAPALDRPSFRSRQPVKQAALSESERKVGIRSTERRLIYWRLPEVNLVELGGGAAPSLRHEAERLNPGEVVRRGHSRRVGLRFLRAGLCAWRWWPRGWCDYA